MSFLSRLLDIVQEVLSSLMTPLEEILANILPKMFSSSHSGFTVIQNCEAETKTVVCYSQTSITRFHVCVNAH